MRTSCETWLLLAWPSMVTKTFSAGGFRQSRKVEKHDRTEQVMSSNCETAIITQGLDFQFEETYTGKSADVSYYRIQTAKLALSR